MKANISGFPEFLPNEQIVFNRVMQSIKDHFELYGFVPMETAAVEKVDVLLAKGNDNEIYGLYRLADKNSKKDLGLRFDLTVPLARYVTQNAGELIFPFKRYQIAPVWRGERPQYGRYRQFYQCDVDIIGDGTLSIDHDAEIISLVTWALSTLKVPDFHTKINNRKILTGFFSKLVGQNKLIDAIRLVDKSEKISPEEFESGMIELLNNEKDFSKIKTFLDADQRGSMEEILNWLQSLSLGEEFAQGVEELSTVVQILRRLGLSNERLKISTRLARGLTYYTGTIFETVFDDIKDTGSVAGGGRYDDLSTTLGNSKKYPGVGATIGISRLVPKLIELGLISTDKKSTADLLITVQDRSLVPYYMKLANKFRALGIKTETYLQDKPLGAQLTYANKKGINIVLIANEVEILDSKAIIRNLKTREQKIIRTEFIGNEIKQIFGSLA
ncbi:MAG: histidine--tRNA ligase [Alphaproteobacteria bacterium]|nr:histidine--tRNA ligase [Alphaproteobacteria bacterium]MBO7536941.1 histidine--tRNA ligase [Alphaproteobacteria bacterium]MBO7642003.1 histidine--tRNA ligase [Alphaproteobacteria bacterium]